MFVDQDARPADRLTVSDHLTYRPDVDGLRAVAVIGVIFAHLRLIPVGHFAVPGGIAGVDVFFVISGYLISRIIYNETAEGTFSLTNFYARRARRILPATLLVCGLTMLAGFIVLHPLEFERLSRSFLAALFFGANIYFYSTADYFGPAANELPLLHLWSLGVEEQFYLVFPLFAITAQRFGWRAFSIALLAIALVSLAAAQYQLGNNPPAVFYLLPYRAFELLIGACCAIPAVRTMSSGIVPKISGVVGLFLIAYSYHYIDAERFSFPGAAALPACIGSALIIWSGEKTANPVTRILGLRPIVEIGRWSFSLYLYHWPILFLVHRLFPQLDKVGAGLLVLTSTVILSWLTYRFVETPARRLRMTAKRSLRYAGAALTTSAALGLFVSATGGLSWRMDAKANYYMSFLNYQNAEQFKDGKCFINYLQRYSDLAPLCIASSTKPMAFLWGDSGAAQYASELDKAANKYGYDFRQATTSGCAPAIGMVVPDRPHCVEFNDRVLERILELRPDIVILSAAWSAVMPIYDYVEETIKRLHAANLNVVVLGFGPGYKIPVPTILADRHKSNNPSLLSDNDLLRVWIQDTEAMFKRRVKKYPNARYVSIIQRVCPDFQCPLLAGGQPAHSDLFHVTEAGAALFVSQFAGLIFEPPSETQP